MKIRNIEDGVELEIGDVDKDGEVVVTFNYHHFQQREHLILGQLEIRCLIEHLQKQIKTGI